MITGSAEATQPTHVNDRPDTAEGETHQPLKKKAVHKTSFPRSRYSPYFIRYGRDPVLPEDTLLQPRHRYTGEEYIPAMFEHLHNAYTHVTQNTLQTREHNKTLVSNSAIPSNF